MLRFSRDLKPLNLAISLSLAILLPVKSKCFKAGSSGTTSNDTIWLNISFKVYKQGKSQRPLRLVILFSLRFRVVRLAMQDNPLKSTRRFLFKFKFITDLHTDPLNSSHFSILLFVRLTLTSLCWGNSESSLN